MGLYAVVVGGRASPDDHDGKVEAAIDDRVEVASEGKTVSGGARDPATCTECRLPGGGILPRLPTTTMWKI